MQSRVTIYWCSYGPLDCQGNFATVDSIAGQKRKRPLEYGTANRTGCQAHFTAIVHQEDPQKVQIRLQRPDHVNAAGQPCHGSEYTGKIAMKRTGPSLSKACHAYVAECLLRGIPAKSILQQWQQRKHAEYADKHKLQSDEAARIEMVVRFTSELSHMYAMKYPARMRTHRFRMAFECDVYIDVPPISLPWQICPAAHEKMFKGSTS